MSTTDGRRERMQRLLKCLVECKNSAGLTANEIGQRTLLPTEITMDRLHKYLAELELCAIIVRQGQRYKINDAVLGTSIKNEREKKIKREAKKK